MVVEGAIFFLAEFIFVFDIADFDISPVECSLLFGMFLVGVEIGLLTVFDVLLMESRSKWSMMEDSILVLVPPLRCFFSLLLLRDVRVFDIVVPKNRGGGRSNTICRVMTPS